MWEYLSYGEKKSMKRSLVFWSWLFNRRKMWKFENFSLLQPDRVCSVSKIFPLFPHSLSVCRSCLAWHRFRAGKHWNLIRFICKIEFSQLTFPFLSCISHSRWVRVYTHSHLRHCCNSGGSEELTTPIFCSPGPPSNDTSCWMGK